MNVEKRFEVRGRDEHDLVWKLDLLREALRRRSGAVLKIACSSAIGCGEYVATVHYRVPVAALARAGGESR
jgi:hypothetical protein